MVALLDILKKHPVPLYDRLRHRFYYPLPDWGVGYNHTGRESTLAASNDWDTVLDFLSMHQHTKNSHIAYSAALEKFLLWLLVDKQKTITDLKFSDFSDYYLFLKNPHPVSYWVGSNTKKTTSSGAINTSWRPFTGRFEDGFDPTNATEKCFKKNVIQYGLSETAIRHNGTIIAAFFKFLLEKGYINGMPVAPFKKLRGEEQRQKEKILERILPPGAFEDIIDYLDAEEKKHPADSFEHFNIIRNRFIIKMFYTTGLRLSELANARFRDVKFRANRNFYELVLDGKGGKRRHVVFYKDTLEAIKEFRAYFLDDNPYTQTQPRHPRYSHYNSLLPSQFDDKAHPIIPQTDLLTPVSDRRIDQLIKPVFVAVGDIYLQKAKKYNPKSDERMKLMNMAGQLHKASAHWLRHSHATQFTLKHKNDYKAISERLGHSDLNTTLLYVHVVRDYF